MSDSMTRRDVMKAGAVLGAGSLVAPVFASGVSRRGSGTIRVGVIGCGGRGTGAAVNTLEADPGTRVVALADLFPDRLSGSLERLMAQEDYSDRVDVPEERRYTGFDAYKKLLAHGDVDLVILATPPGFRPAHFEAAIGAGKHVFMEKPAAVDPAGVRLVIEAARRADEHGLSVVAGTQRRHQDNYRELIERVQDGAIGEIVSARCYWNQGGLWVHQRQPSYTDMEWQVRNWLYFSWLSGDHICEQHVHNIDVINWAKGGPPAKAMGMGGREVRTGEEYGNIFDHFAVDYEYADGTPLLSMCRQTDGCAGKVAEHIVGTKGRCTSWHGHSKIESGPQAGWQIRGRENPYVTEHVNLIASIRGQRARLNEAQRVAESTLAAIMGRMSAYTGKEITWDQAMNSTLDLTPGALAFGPLEVAPVPTPGRTPFV